MTRLFLEEYYFLNEWNIITNNTKKRICCCSCSKKTNRSYSQLSSTNRISRPEVFCKKDVLGNFAKFIGKHLSQSLFINKVAGLRPATLLKKKLWGKCFPLNFAKFLRTPFFTEHLWWLPLYKNHRLENTANFPTFWSNEKFFFKKSSSSQVSFCLLVLFLQWFLKILEKVR